MTTKNIIPQADGEGSIGINGTSWASGVFNTGIFDNIGIGTTVPDHKLHISGGLPSMKLEGLQPRIWLSETDQTDLNTLIRNNNSLFLIDTAANDDSFVANRLTINHANGNVGINTANPSEKFEVKSSVISLFRGVNEAGLRNGLQFKLGDSDSTDIPQIYGAVGAVIEKNIAGSHDGALAFTTTKNGVHTVEQEAMRITSDGKVGIGTTSPSSKLQVNTFKDVTSVAVPCTSGQNTISLTEDLTSVLSAGDTIRFGNSGAGDASTKQYEVESITDSLLTLTQALNFTASLHISKNLPTLNVQSSNVGIGTDSPDRLLSVEDSSSNAFISLVSKNDSRSAILLGDTDSDGQGRIDYDNSDNHLHFSTVQTERMRIDSDGNVGIGNTSPAAKLDVQGDISISGAIVSSDSDGRVLFSNQGLMVGQAEVKPDPDNPQSIYFNSVPQVQDSEGNAVTILTADKLGLGTSASLTGIDDDIKFKLLTDQQRFVVGTTGDYGLGSGWYRFNDFKVKGATDIGVNSINPVDTRIYSDESSFVLFTTDVAGNRVAHLVGGDEEVSPNNAIALGIAIKVDSSESPEDIEFVHTDGESYSVINGNSDSIGINGLPIRQGFQTSSLGSSPSPLLIDGGSF